MISYILAKKLKENGFPKPQKDNNYYCYLDSDNKKNPIVPWRLIKDIVGVSNKVTDYCTFIPQLDYLLDVIFPDDGGKHEIKIERDYQSGYSCIAYFNDKLGGGKTPEEAIANLWLNMKEN